MIIKLVIYKDQLQSQSSKQAISKNCELFRCNTKKKKKKTISRSPNLNLVLVTNSIAKPNVNS